VNNAVPEWARWRTSDPYTVGAEEEIMLLDEGCELAYAADAVIAALPPELARSVAPETHGAALEIASAPHTRVSGVAAELRELRLGLERAVGERGMRLAGSGTHPCAQWHGTVISPGARQQAVYSSMRELARREPTFALHVHVGIPDPEDAVRVANRLRAHLPLLLALSANSPFWQGRDAGLASTRTPLFQAFPRVGIPRAFAGYEEWVETVDVLIRSLAFPEPTFLWWDIRLQPRFGTVEVRILDAQTTVEESAGLCALVQCLARLEAQDGYASRKLVDSPELLAENRFLAARDGMDAGLLDPLLERAVPARVVLDDALAACAPHARALNCVDELELVEELAERTGAAHQRLLARAAGGLPPVAEALAGAFTGADDGLGAAADGEPRAPAVSTAG
jgi:glutamate---cysteine ligase / carboxylate-amine ligase